MLLTPIDYINAINNGNWLKMADAISKHMKKLNSLACRILLICQAKFESQFFMLIW